MTSDVECYFCHEPIEGEPFIDLESVSRQEAEREGWLFCSKGHWESTIEAQGMDPGITEVW